MDAIEYFGEVLRQSLAPGCEVGEFSPALSLELDQLHAVHLLKSFQSVRVGGPNMPRDCRSIVAC